MFFDTMYGWTRGLYGDNLDRYLFDNDDVLGYFLIGVVMLACTIVASPLYYYLLKPVRKQMTMWFLVFAADAALNFIFVLYYTMTPLVNNEIDTGLRWRYCDSVLLGLADILWSFVFYVIAALFLKWGSVNRYIPFKKF